MVLVLFRRICHAIHKISSKSKITKMVMTIGVVSIAQGSRAFGDLPSASLAQPRITDWAGSWEGPRETNRI